MENQVKLSCFSPVSVHLEIWLQLFWRLLDQNQSRFDSEAAAEAKRAFTGENTLNSQPETEDMRRLSVKQEENKNIL